MVWALASHWRHPAFPTLVYLSASIFFLVSLLCDWPVFQERGQGVIPSSLWVFGHWRTICGRWVADRAGQYFTSLMSNEGNGKMGEQNNIQTQMNIHAPTKPDVAVQTDTACTNTFPQAFFWQVSTTMKRPWAGLWISTSCRSAMFRLILSSNLPVEASRNKNVSLGDYADDMLSFICYCNETKHN